MFRDRADAGKRLAEVLMQYGGDSLVVFALPRGGVALGVEIARCLHAPLDLIVVRKIGHPQSPEYAVGAVTEDGEVVLNPAESEALDSDWIVTAAQTELAEARRRRAVFLPNRPAIPAKGKTAIIVDDGLATGLTMEAALRQLTKQQPRKVIVAVPVAAAETVSRLRSAVDEVVVLYAPAFFGAVSAFYKDFNQLSDSDVIALMESARTG